MQIFALMLSLLSILAFATLPTAALAQGTESASEQTEALDDVVNDVIDDAGDAANNAVDDEDGADAAGDALESSTIVETPVTEPTQTDEDLEELYEGEDDIEVIKVRGGESEGAADFETGDSVAAFDAADLDALGAQSIADLASFTPNLEIVTAGATTPTFFIRGVGLNDFNANSSGAVAIYFNDVPKNSPALQLGTLFDVGNVNVLRGPQGTGNYRSASAGAIKIYSQKPSGTYNAYLSQSYGNYNSIDLEGAVGGPVYEDYLSARFAFRFSDRDGTGKNGCGGAPPRDERAIRPDAGVQNGGGQGNDPRWSICGDDVPFEGQADISGGDTFDGASLIPAGLPKRTNDQHNWAARGTMLFQPTLDQEWLLIVSGGNRDEQTGQGQSYGTQREGGSIIGPFGLSGRGVLGSEDGTSYIPLDVQEQRWALNPCLNNKTGSSELARLPSAPLQPRFICNTGVDTSADLNKARFANFVSRSVLAKDLARNLDKRPRHGDYNKAGRTELETWGVSLKGDIVVADSISVTTVTGFDSYDRFVETDLDQSPNKNFEIATTDKGFQVAQTIELSGDVGEDVPITWKVGGLYLYEELDVLVENDFGGFVAVIGVSAREYTQKLWSGGGYGEFTFSFWEKFSVDAGIRYNWERKSMDYLLAGGSGTGNALYARNTWQAPTGTVRMTYNFKENTYFFWKYTRGWKGGHYNATGGDDGIVPANPENIDAFEIGAHGTWFTGFLTIDMSLFHYNYEQYQLFTARQRFDGLPEFVVINASDAEIYGTEIDLVLRPTPSTTLGASFAWLSSQFLDYTQIQTESREFGFGNLLVLNNEIQNSGNPLLNSPEFKIAMTAQQAVPLGRLGTLTARWDGAWTAATNYDATESRGTPNFDGEQFLPKFTIGQRSYWLHNVRLSYRTPNSLVDLALWVRNVGDQAYKSFAFDASSFNGTTIYAVNAPRTYGLTLRTEF